MFDSWFQFKLFQSGEITFPLGISPPLCLISTSCSSWHVRLLYGSSTLPVLIAFGKTKAKITLVGQQKYLSFKVFSLNKLARTVASMAVRLC